MIPMVYPWCHSTISNQKTSKRKVVLKADIRWRLRIRTFDEPERRCREVREVMKKRGFPERKLDGNPQRLKRRRATLPHPLECSTIAAPGLSYRVRNGTGRLTRAMTTAKPRSRNDSQNTWRPFRPFNYRVAVWEPASGREAKPTVVSFSDHPNAYCRPGRSSTGKTRNQPQKNGWNVMSPSPVSTGRLHPSRGFHLRPIKHVFNMRATGSRRSMES